MIEVVELTNEVLNLYCDEAGIYSYFVGTRYLDAGFMPRLKVIAAFMEEHDAQFFLKSRMPSDGGWKIYKIK
jgi:hypothetical protein